MSEGTASPHAAVLLITSLKAEGARELAGGDFLRGRPLLPKSDMLLEG